MKRPAHEDRHPPLKDFLRFITALSKESDRGAALISAAMLDDLLEQTIRAFLIAPPGNEDLLSGFNAPLGTFSAVP